MRRMALLVLAMALGGCAQLDRLVGDVALRSEPDPPPAPPVTTDPTEVEPCTFPWQREVPPVTRDDLRIGPLVFRGLGDPSPAWWFAPAGVVAEQLRTGELPEGWTRQDGRDFADEAIDYGREKFVARDVLIDVPAATTAEIAVPEDEVNVGLLPRGVPQFGGYVPADGVKRVRCEADAATSFHVGFVVAGPRCVPVVVVVDGRAEAKRVRFGVRRCARPVERRG